MELLLTYAKPSDRDESLAELNEFYRQNRSDFVKERDPEQFLRAIDSKKLFVMRDATTGELRAACGLFEYGVGSFREVGGVRVLEEGFGLQRLLMSVAVISEWTFDPFQQPLFAATALENGKSITNIQRTGFVRTTDLGADRMRAMDMAEPDEMKAYFLYPDIAVKGTIEFLEPIFQSRLIQRPHGTLKLSFDIPIFDIGLPAF